MRALGGALRTVETRPLRRGASGLGPLSIRRATGLKLLSVLLKPTPIGWDSNRGGKLMPCGSDVIITGGLLIII